MSSEDTPVPTSLAQGVQAHGPVDAKEAEGTKVRTVNDVPKRENENVDAVDSMATLGEGDVAHAVERKSGTQRAPGQKGEVSFDDYAADLERKKEEQAEAREAIKEARRAGEIVD